MEQNHIFIKLLGSPEIRMDGQAVKLPFRQAEAMVYYLAVSGSVSKDRLCDLLWGDRYPEDKAKSSLRNAICVVRNRLGRDVLMEPTRQHIALNPDCGVQVDAAVYLRPGTELGGSGEFLSGFHLKGSEVFDEWSAAMAQTIRDAYCTRAKTAVEEAWGREDTEGCLQLCRELIAANEYDEFGYRYLMLCLSRKQDYRLRVTIRESQALLAQVEDPEIWATWMRLQGVCEVIAGDYAEAYQRLSGAADLFLSFDNADVYAYSVGACWAWMGEALRLQGDSDAAELLYRQAITLCENSRASGGIAVFYAFYARCLLDRDVPREQDEDRAEAMLARGRELCSQFNLLWYRGVTYAYSALSACRRGEPEQAGRFLREARAAAVRLESSYEQSVAEEIVRRVHQFFSAAPEQLRRFEEALLGS